MSFKCKCVSVFASLCIFVTLFFSVNVFAANNTLNIQDISTYVHKDYVNKTVEIGIKIHDYKKFLDYYRVEAQYDGISRKIDSSLFNEGDVAIIKSYYDVKCEDEFTVKVMFLDLFSWSSVKELIINEDGHFFDDGTCLVCGKREEIREVISEIPDNDENSEDVETEYTENDAPEIPETTQKKPSITIIEKKTKIKKRVTELYANKKSLNETQRILFEDVVLMYNQSVFSDDVKEYELDNIIEILDKIDNAAEITTKPVQESYAKAEPVPETGRDHVIAYWATLAFVVSCCIIFVCRKNSTESNV